METEDRWLIDFFKNSLDTPERKEIAQRLIDRAVEMQPVYAELNKKLHSSSQKQCVMQAVIDMAVLYRENVRSEMSLSKEKKNEIAATADKLCRLIEGYRNKESRFRPCIPNLFELINDAGNNTYYNLQIKDKIDKIRSDDLRFLYAPDIQDILKILAAGLYEKDPEPNYSEDQAVLQSQKFSRFDFVRALWRRLELCNKSMGSLLPRGFRLSYKAIGVIARSVLNLSPDDDVSEDDVKKALKPVFA